MAKILIIEDDELIQKMYKDKFQKNGHEVLQAFSSSEAESALQQTTPDIALIDIMLPGGENGFDILSKMRLRSDAWATIPVIIITNLTGEEKAAYDLKADDYIVKANVKPSEIVARVEELLSK